MFSRGGEGGIDLARKVLELVEKGSRSFRFAYSLELSLKEKIEVISREIYGADGVEFSREAQKELENLEKLGYGNLPVCIAKTQYSLSDNPKLLGRPEGFKITVKQVKVSAGAGFVVAITGEIMTMPGLPKEPAAEKIDINQEGKIVGLF